MVVAPDDGGPSDDDDRAIEAAVAEANAEAPVHGRGRVHLQRRGFIVFLLLSIVTFGIYRFFYHAFVHRELGDDLDDPETHSSLLVSWIALVTVGAVAMLALSMSAAPLIAAAEEEAKFEPQDECTRVLPEGQRPRVVTGNDSSHEANNSTEPEPEWGIEIGDDSDCVSAHQSTAGGLFFDLPPPYKPWFALVLAVILAGEVVFLRYVREQYGRLQEALSQTDSSGKLGMGPFVAFYGVGVLG